MSRLVLKRFPGQGVLIDGTTRLTLNSVRRDGRDDYRVTLTLETPSPAGGAGEVTCVKFGLPRGQPVPVATGLTVELQDAYFDRDSGGRAWLLFEGEPSIKVTRAELVDGADVRRPAPPGPLAPAPTAPPGRDGILRRTALAVSMLWLGILCWWQFSGDEEPARAPTPALAMPTATGPARAACLCQVSAAACTCGLEADDLLVLRRAEGGVL